VRWLLGGELHPGGETLTRRAFELIRLDADDRLVDVGSGDGATVMLAAREHGCHATGVEYGAGAVEDARARAAELRRDGRVEFVPGDAGALPLADATVDAVISECSLCTFTDKGGAIGEMRRVLIPGGRLVLSDMIAEVERLPGRLRGALGAIACVGEALPPGGHRELLEGAGFEVLAEEDRTADAIEMTDRIADRVRGAKMLGLDDLFPLDGGAAAALELLGEARAAIADGRIGYVLVAARRV